MPAGLQRLQALRVGDIVSVAVWRFGDEYAETRVPEDQDLHTEEVRDEGKVVGKDSSGTKWLVDFDDPSVDVSAWLRVALRFERRPGAAAAGAAGTSAPAGAREVSSSDEDERPETPLTPY